MLDKHQKPESLQFFQSGLFIHTKASGLWSKTHFVMSNPLPWLTKQNSYVNSPRSTTGHFRTLFRIHWKPKSHQRAIFVLLTMQRKPLEYTHVSEFMASVQWPELLREWKYYINNAAYPSLVIISNGFGIFYSQEDQKSHFWPFSILELTPIGPGHRSGIFTSHFNTKITHHSFSVI